MPSSLTAALLVTLALSAPATQPLQVEAWKGTGKHEFRDTRTLAQLADFNPPSADTIELDSYGGWKNAPPSLASLLKSEPAGRRTPFFHVDKTNTRTWLVTPDGNPYLNIAINTVTTANRDPKPGWTFSSDDEWRDKTLAYLKSLGFNGTGAWSRDELLSTAKTNRLPYTPIWNFMSAYGHKRGGTYQQPGHTGYPNDCIFAFDPEFPAFCDQHARLLEPTKNDPYLLGHLTDNELPFPANALDRYLQLPGDDPGHKAAEAWLADRRKTSGNSGPATQPSGAAYTDAERADFRGYVIDTYFHAVTTAIRKHDPNHLILGSRFHANELSSPQAFQAAGKYLDVISINYYGAWTPRKETLDNWTTWSGRPVVITEWYAKGADSGFKNLTGAGFTVPTQRDRGLFYQNFTLALLAHPRVVGWHWFKFVDNDPNDPHADPSNRDSNKGLVNIDQKPYEPLAALMKQLNEAAYPLTGYFDSRR